MGEDIHNLKNGMILLSTEVSAGLYNSLQLKKISELCDGDMAVVKATEDQRLALFVPEKEIDRIASQLKEVGLGVRNYSRGLHQPVTCIGELCQFSEQESLADTMALSEILSNIEWDSNRTLKIGVNGCYRSCVPSHTLDISILGETNGYRLSLGGKNSQIPEFAALIAEGVPKDKLIPLLKEVIALYQAKAREEESLQDLLDRDGAQDFIKILHPFSQDASLGIVDPFAQTTESPDAEKESDTLISPIDSSEDIEKEDSSESSLEEISVDPCERDEDMNPSLDDKSELQLEEDVLISDNEDPKESSEIGISSEDGDIADIAPVEEPIDPKSSDSDNISLLEEEPLAIDEESEEISSLEIEEPDPNPEEELSFDSDELEGDFGSSESLESESIDSLEAPEEVSLEKSEDLDENLEEIAEEGSFSKNENLEEDKNIGKDGAEEETSLQEDEENDLEHSIEESIEEEKNFLDKPVVDPNISNREKVILDLGKDKKLSPNSISGNSKFNLADAQVSNVELTNDGFLELEFDNGFKMKVSFDKLKDRTSGIKILNKQVSVTWEEGGFNIEIDDISLFFPRESAA